MPIEQDKEFDSNIWKVDNNTIKFTRTQEQTMTRTELGSQKKHYISEMKKLTVLIHQVDNKIAIMDK